MTPELARVIVGTLTGAVFLPFAVALLVAVLRVAAGALR